VGRPAGAGDASASGIATSKLSCDVIEDTVVKAKICYDFSEHVCHRNRLDIQKVRHPHVGVEPLNAQRCPPCSNVEKGPCKPLSEFSA
jgi:hypothetical protein